MHSFSIDFITGNTTANFYKDLSLENEQETQPDTTNDSFFNTTQNFEDIYSVISKDPVMSAASPMPGYLIQNPVVDTTRDSDLSEGSSVQQYLIQNPAVDTNRDPNLSAGSPVQGYLIQNQVVDTSRDSDLSAGSPIQGYLIQNPAVDTTRDSDLTAGSPIQGYLIQNSEVTSRGSSDSDLSVGSPDSDIVILTPDSLDRGTPSPTLDSGIESTGCSPNGSEQSSEDVAQTLEDLEKKATKITKSSKSTDKPGLSYIALIAQAILSTGDNKMALADIYKHIRDNHSYYDNEERAWRNSIRYNLSINECFIKAGKEESGKGNYWAIHPICLTDFTKGDYRRRQARRRARRGTRTLDLDTVPQPRNVNYAAMTHSYLGYHPYGAPSLASGITSGMVPVHPYSMTSSAPMYQSQNSAFTPAQSLGYVPGKPMYTTQQAYQAYTNYVAAPFTYMPHQSMAQKPAQIQKYRSTDYQTSDTQNTIILQ